MHTLIIFASGSGTNTKAIIDYFRGSDKVSVALIVCNVPGAGVLDIARNEDIPFLIVDKKTIGETLITEQLLDYKPSLIVLAGFLWKIPESLLHAFPGKIINIHPALLPAFGGKGMYGQKVHAAVIEAGATETGITIHYVNEHYDDGNIILQARCQVEEDDNETTLAHRVLRSEHYYYPRAIEFLLESGK